MNLDQVALLIEDSSLGGGGCSFQMLAANKCLHGEENNLSEHHIQSIHTQYSVGIHLLVNISSSGLETDSPGFCFFLKKTYIGKEFILAYGFENISPW